MPINQLPYIVGLSVFLVTALGAYLLMQQAKQTAYANGLRAGRSGAENNVLLGLVELLASQLKANGCPAHELYKRLEAISAPQEQEA